ncbi:MAG: helix-turn-helix transcriptional regulator [Planctomycetaceae bacterium]|uniref:Lineage-specific thermal regulator protein n=1 Tax=Lacipirellula limnantheis TaxID=2528024 RepID=A0A517U4Z2_9BACT|nr:helix-turn-helix transcriptional regulator [Lacipirellula limnantheis]MBL9163068.1 helix-turn-helix transcriptional regulator [Planctomycetaceae bacterium]QDT75708.1 lineage-specific thermal regulator protein [Lacipirellula limnantheis]
MAERKSNPAFLNGVPEMLILQLLSRQAMYGYEIVQAIKADSNDELEFGEGCIYPILHRLESDGLLTATKELASGRTRVVYRCTRRGKARLAKSISNWRRIADAVNLSLEGGGNVRSALA